MGEESRKNHRLRKKEEEKFSDFDPRSDKAKILGILGFCIIKPKNKNKRIRRLLIG